MGNNQETIKLADVVNDNEISNVDITLLEKAINNLQDTDASNKKEITIEELQNGFSDKEINSILKAIPNENKETEPYKGLIEALNNLTEEAKEKTDNTTEILNKPRTLNLAKKLIETNETNFNKIFNEFKNKPDLINNTKFKEFCAAYSDYKADEIGKITVKSTTADDEQFVEGTKVINIIPKNKTKKTERFTFGPVNKLVTRYKEFISVKGKLTTKNLEDKFKIIEKDCNGATNTAGYYDTLAKQIGQNKELQNKFLTLFISNGKVNKDMLKYLGSDKTEQMKNINTISENMTETQKEQIKVIQKSLGPDKKKEGPKDFIDGLTDDLDNKYGPIKNILLKLLNMPELKGIFDDFFKNHPRLETMLTNQYKLSDHQEKVVDNIRKSLNTKNNPIQNMEDIVSSKNIDNIKEALTKNISSDDISPEFKDYMMDITGKNPKDYINNSDIIADYMKELADKDSPLRKNYEDTMDQLKSDGINDADLIQIMSASILNFKENGVGMKYLWTKNNTETSNTNTKNTETKEETETEKLAREFKEMLAKPEPTDKELITFYDKLFTDGKTLKGGIEDMGITTKEEATEMLTKRNTQLEKYITAITTLNIEKTYNIPKLNQLKANISTIITDNSTELDKSLALSVIKNLGEEELVKPFPEDLKKKITSLKSSTDTTKEHKDTFKLINQNYDTIVPYFKKSLLVESTDYLNTKDFITQIKFLLNIKTDSNTSLIENGENMANLIGNIGDYPNQSINITDNNKIQIVLKDKGGTTKKTISMTKQSNENLPKFTLA